MDENVRARIADIEREAAAGGSRNAEALAAYTRGSLAGLVTSLAAFMSATPIRPRRRRMDPSAQAYWRTCSRRSAGSWRG
jgi:hypothetical protein